MTSWKAELQVRVGTFELDVTLNGDETPLALVGPNGSGKTTVLRALAGALCPTAGRVVVGDRTLYDHMQGIDVSSERRRIGYVPQGYGLFPHLRVLDNVAFGLLVSSSSRNRAACRTAASAMLEQLECAHLAERWPQHLSGGEQQRVALARALVIEPEMLLLDEPLAALDVGAKRAVRGWLATWLRSWNRPSIVVTHDVRDVAALGGDVCVLEAGHVLQRGSLDVLRAEPANDFVAELCGE